MARRRGYERADNLTACVAHIDAPLSPSKFMDGNAQSGTSHVRDGYSGHALHRCWSFCRANRTPDRCAIGGGIELPPLAQRTSQCGDRNGSACYAHTLHSVSERAGTWAQTSYDEHEIRLTWKLYAKGRRPGSTGMM